MALDIKKVDLTNGTQKFIALVMIGVVLRVLWYCLPPLIVIFSNLLILSGLLLVFGFLVFNYRNIWMLFKQITFVITKKMISQNPVWYMYNYHTYILDNIKKLDESIVKISGIKDKLGQSISKADSELKNYVKQFEAYKAKGITDGKIQVIASKVEVLDKQMKVYEPRYKGIIAQEKQLRELSTAWLQDAETLKFTLDAKSEEYYTLKELAKATGTASQFLRGDSQESREYQLSIQAIEQSCSEFSGIIEDFDRRSRPLLEERSIQSEISVENGLQLIEQFRTQRLSLPQPQTIDITPR